MEPLPSSNELLAKNRGLSGHYVERSVDGTGYSAFVPHPLPPVPPLHFDARLRDLLERASRTLGRLDGLALHPPDPSFFRHFYVRKEAVFSSRIEGARTTLTDLLLYESGETPRVPLDDVESAARHEAALRRGIELLEEGLPIGTELLYEVHRELREGGHDVDGERRKWRRQHGRGGNTGTDDPIDFPPPHEEIPAALDALDRFMNDDPRRTPALIKAALAHAQFVTIQPFPGVNGPVARMLVTLLLIAEGSATHEPLLYLSRHLERHESRYRQLLRSVREDGAWESWLAFFLEGVIEIAAEATEIAIAVEDLFERDHEAIADLGRAAPSAMRVHAHLRLHPIIGIPATAEAVDLTQPTVASALRRLEELGVVREITGKKRNRRYAYESFIALLEDASEA